LIPDVSRTDFGINIDIRLGGERFEPDSFTIREEGVSN
jgi:hypothetical protein